MKFLISISLNINNLEILLCCIMTLINKDDDFDISKDLELLPEQSDEVVALLQVIQLKKYKLKKTIKPIKHIKLQKKINTQNNWTKKEEIQLFTLVKREGDTTSWKSKAKRIGNGKRTLKSVTSKWERIERKNELFNLLYSDDPPIIDHRSPK